MITMHSYAPMRSQILFHSQAKILQREGRWKKYKPNRLWKGQFSSGFLGCGFGVCINFGKIIIELVWNFWKSSSMFSSIRNEYCSNSLHFLFIDFPLTISKANIEAVRFFVFVFSFIDNYVIKKSLHKENIAREIELKRYFTFIVTLLFLLSMDESWGTFMKLPGDDNNQNYYRCFHHCVGSAHTGHRHAEKGTHETKQQNPTRHKGKRSRHRYERY